MRYHCIFCSQNCQFSEKYGDYHCTKCNVQFQGEEDYLTCMVFARTINKRRYELTIDINHNSTKLTVWTAESDYFQSPEVITQFKPVMNGVTPENAESKIKTLLVFS